MIDCRMFLAFISTKILRKRWALLVIFLLSLTYFMHSTFPNMLGRFNSHSESVLILERPQKSFHWSPRFDKVNESKTCRNSVQGKTLLADDHGYVCERKDLLARGCCNVQGASTKQHVCDSCLDNNCCSIYEHCVSCCLHPGKQPLLRKILSRASDTFNNLFASVTDHFELCLAKCRTSSQSVQHENSYRDPKAKYCYGEDPPTLSVGKLRR